MTQTTPTDQDAPLDDAPRQGSRGGSLLLVGLDHRSAPLELRERVALNDAMAEDLLVRLLARPEIGEAFVLSTCNRTETYVQALEPTRAFHTVLSLTFGDDAETIENEGRFFMLREKEAARHLFAVASGLESMVLGEPEILGQVKQAGDLAIRVGAAENHLEQLIRGAVTTGSRARRETEIGAGAISLGYAVVELALHIFNRLDNRVSLILGAGETATLTCRSLTEKGIGRVMVANRTPERAAELASAFPQVTSMPWERRHDLLDDADLVVAATGAQEPILTKDDVGDVMSRRPSRPLLSVDLGVPRNVDPAVGGLENVFLHDIDSLHHLVERNLEKRRTQVPRVEQIVNEELHRYETMAETLAVEPLVAALQRRAEEIRRREVDRIRERFPPETHDDLDRATRSLVRKILHHPSSQLRSASPHKISRLKLFRELFQLYGEDDES